MSTVQCPFCLKFGHKTTRSKHCLRHKPPAQRNEPSKNQAAGDCDANVLRTRRSKNKREEPPPEPKIKWEKSMAKQMLYTDIVNGKVPLESVDVNMKSTMKLRDIYTSRPEFKKYHYDKFSSRLASLRKTIKQRNERAVLDKEAFDNFVANHPVSCFSHKGYIQWQGSEAQALFKKLLEQGELDPNFSREDLHSSYSEFFENFPLKAFRDKVNQEFRTAEYLHTLRVKVRIQGRSHK